MHQPPPHKQHLHRSLHQPYTAPNISILGLSINQRGAQHLRHILEALRRSLQWIYSRRPSPVFCSLVLGPLLPSRGSFPQLPQGCRCYLWPPKLGQLPQSCQAHWTRQTLPGQLFPRSLLRSVDSPHPRTHHHCPTPSAHPDWGRHWLTGPIAARRVVQLLPARAQQLAACLERQQARRAWSQAPQLWHSRPVHRCK